MEYAIESRFDEPIAVGRGTAILLKGWCYHPTKKLRKLDVLVDGKPYPVSRHSQTRFDILRDRDADLVGNGNALNSGFTVLLPISQVYAPETVKLTGRASFTGGTEDMDFGELQVYPGPEVHETAAPAKVAICVITHNPPATDFERLVRSLKEQTVTEWTCLVNDDESEPAYLEAIRRATGEDPRFQVFSNAEQLNSYEYFERMLQRVPAEAEFVAVCEQADNWMPNKLEQCLGALKPGVDLVYSDAAVAGEEGVPARELTLESALLTNLVSLGACVFRRSLLDTAIPLPPRTLQGKADDWVVCVGAGSGNVAHVPLALVTLAEPKLSPLEERNIAPLSRGKAMLSELSWMDEPMAERSNPESILAQRAENVWLPERVALWSLILLERGNAKSPKRKLLDTASCILDSNKSSAAFAQRAARVSKDARDAAWVAHFALSAERLLSTFTQRHRADVLGNLRSYWGVAGRKPAMSGGPGLDRAKAEIDFIPQKIAPLNLEISSDNPRRVNIVTSTIDFRYLFGGYFAVFSLALKLSAAGFKVRLILTDPVDYKPAFWKREIRKYHGLSNFFDEVEVAPNYERNPLPVSPTDQFIATSWWTAFAAHSGAQQLGLERFIYLSQDFEPYFYPASSFYALAMQSYTFPHHAIFSTEFLREYSRVHGYGVFKDGTEKGDANSVSFPNAITAPTPKRERLERTGKKRLLVYARPEDHANRNCFQLAALGVAEAAKEGCFPRDEWEIHGIGSVQIFGTLKLTNRADMQLLPKVSLAEYYNLLPTYDVGLSLMLTPHPSLVPLDMAASGLVTVTNTFDIKTKEKLQPISSNLVIVEPTIEGIKYGLMEAVHRAADIDARMAGTKLNWARSWDEAFSPEFVQKVAGWINGR